ncbi:LysR family transcriptional regulator [Xenorhabdus griffiniae]|uniref:LysR family transcriptional regulator n=1 Tax=Xenorhabdus griffiniae TaxID=351672 RepID=A0ABY9XN91_9GAMM|nr:LysR family transcriptional regulator [Xenorhabdus griffiniae]MBD1228924.1 LysR family transcriptional regulator [Xenorhabdus griffiniae]MBE8588498.1 LysR family transcriptional regulator [Xenorhabdus griffiniae]WMV74404.1 LysR family transcriptional regulator [Xenorhabdus griffiniae]WNH04084.1 LysR family transcriptional regulator [Xenorhabdus griffiniae]
MDRLTSMAVFVKAAELGSFTATSEVLNMSAQMVSKHIAWLESRLGVTLLNRTTRRQHLTDIGQRYYAQCQLILAEVEMADSLVHDLKSTPSGILKVNAPVTFGSISLTPFITDYLGRYTDTEIELTLSDRIVDPIQEGYEVTIRIGELEDSSLIAHRLRPYQLIACASQDYLNRFGTPNSPSELSMHSCLIYGIWTVSMPCRWIFIKEGQAEEVKPQGRFRSNDWKALLHAAIEGYGITLGPRDILQNEINSGRLAQILTDYQTPARPMHVLTPSTQRPVAKIRCFIDALKERFGQY